jgi:hypothetical protein
MKKILSIMIIASLLFIGYTAHAALTPKADQVVSQARSIVSYDIATNEGQDLVLTADYSAARPTPDLENLDITPKTPVKDGVMSFTLRTQEGAPITVEYTYAKGERVGMKFSAEPPNPGSDAEYTQILSVASKAAYIINFTFVWQGGELKEVRIEPLINPFDTE